MTTEDALASAVLAAPDDDVVRKAYADWCRENGQEERADFIEVQLADVDRGSQAKLLDEYAYLWFPPPLVACLSNTGILFQTATQGMIAAHITRGFVSEVRCTMAEWCGGDGGEPILFESPAADYDVVYPSRLRRPGIGPQIVRRHPVERVVLTDREPHENPAGVFVFNRVDGEPEHSSEVPAFIFDLMEGGSAERPTSRTHTVKFYATREYADKALSAALIAWAKEAS